MGLRMHQAKSRRVVAAERVARHAHSRHVKLSLGTARPWGKERWAEAWRLFSEGARAAIAGNRRRVRCEISSFQRPAAA